MKIGNFDASSGMPYIIAEIGSNFTSFEDCVESIKQAALAGANAVKFQYFTHKALYGVPLHRASGYDDKYEMQPAWIPRLKSECDRSRVDFMITCFSHEFVRQVDPYVVAHKIASSDISYDQLLDEVAKMGKPVICSTGAASEFEIITAQTKLKNIPTIFLYCVASYPAPSVDLTVMDRLKKIHSSVGYSDHTTDFQYIPYAACHYHGALVLEKHFTAINDNTPDSRHSLKPHEFKLMVQKIRGQREAVIGAVESEIEMVWQHKRRLIVTEKIQPGELLKRGVNFGPYRSMRQDTDGISPWQSQVVNNKSAKHELEPGHPIRWSDLA